MEMKLNKVSDYFINSKSGKVLKKIFELLLAFFIPFGLSILLFSLSSYYPFKANGHSLLMIDMSGQYIAFFRYYKRMLDGEYNILYTLGKVTGGDFLSIFTYYLASPFNLLLKFFPLSELSAGLMWIVILKISTAGLTSYLVLDKLNKNGLINLVFAVSYALIAYNFIYYSNIMWLDGVLILPLVAYGIIKISKNEAPLLYIFSLAYAIMTSWYIGIIIAIFSVLFFLVQFVTTADLDRKRRRILVFSVGSFLAGLISFSFWGTALVHIIGTKGGSSFTNLPVTIKTFYDVIKIEQGFIYHSYAGMEDIKGPAVAFYVGALPVILTILFFFNNKFSKRERISTLALFGIYLLAFFNKGIDHLFHGGPAPNWFPARYSFVFGFILILYASKSFKEIKEVKAYAFSVPFVIYFALIIHLYLNDYLSNFAGILFVIVMITLLFAISFDKKDEGHVAPFLSGILGLIAITNVFGNNNHVLTSFEETLNHASMESYRKDEAFTSVIDYLKAEDDSLYRLENSFIRSGAYNSADNDALYYGYNGISHYSSSERSDVLNYFKRLGFHYNGFNLNYGSGNTLALNSYLGIKYVINEVNIAGISTNRFLNFTSSLEKVADISDEQYAVYENNYVLPFLFPILTTNIDYVGAGRYEGDQIYYFDVFEYQNNIFKTITNRVVDENGDPKDIFKRADVVTSLSNVSINDNGNYDFNAGGTITYKFNKKYATNYYYFIDGPKNRDLSLRENYTNVTNFSYFGHQINGVNFGSNSSCTLRVSASSKQDNVSIKPAIYYEDLDVLEQYIMDIKNHADIIEFKEKDSAHYLGEVVTKQDDQAMLVTFPYLKNWRVYVDGKQVKVEKKFNIYTSFVIEKAGKHTIKITYTEPTFTLGVPLGLLTIIGVITLRFSVGKKLFKRKEEDN